MADLNLSVKYLSELTEKLTGELVLVIYKEDEILLKGNYNIDILAYNQWNELSIISEILAAYVTLNHPEISKIIKEALKILGKWTGDPSFDGYQSLDPYRVKK